MGGKPSSQQQPIDEGEDVRVEGDQSEALLDTNNGGPDGQLQFKQVTQEDIDMENAESGSPFQRFLKYTRITFWSSRQRKAATSSVCAVIAIIILILVVLSVWKIISTAQGPPTPAPTQGPPSPVPTQGPPSPVPTQGPPTAAPHELCNQSYKLTLDALDRINGMPSLYIIVSKGPNNRLTVNGTLIDKNSYLQIGHKMTVLLESCYAITHMEEYPYAEDNYQVPKIKADVDCRRYEFRRFECGMPWINDESGTFVDAFHAYLVDENVTKADQKIDITAFEVKVVASKQGHSKKTNKFNFNKHVFDIRINPNYVSSKSVAFDMIFRADTVHITESEMEDIGNAFAANWTRPYGEAAAVA